MNGALFPRACFLSFADRSFGIFTAKSEKLHFKNTIYRRFLVTNTDIQTVHNRVYCPNI